MCTLCYLLFIACSLFMTNASILNDLQEAQKFVEQLDYDYSAVAADAAAAQQRPAAAADLLWYDYGGGGGGGSNGGYYGVGGAPVPGAAAVQLIGMDKRGGATQASSGIWFGPRLGRRKRRNGGGPGLVQPVDGNAVGPTGPQEPTMAAAAGQSVASGTWIFVPIIDNTLLSQIKQNTRSGRSSSEDGDDEVTASRHSARSPPYSPPFSPRLGRQATAQARPQVPRLGREALLYRRRDARSTLYQQNASNKGGGGSLYRLPEQQRQQQQQQQQQQSSSAAATQSVATAETQRHAVV